MKYLNIFILIVLFPNSNTAWSQGYVDFASLITPSILKQDLSVLASDSLEGRGTAEPGMQKAIRYTASRFESMGLKPAFGKSYKQDITFVKWSTSAFSATLGGKPLEYGKDYYISTPSDPTRKHVTVSHLKETNLTDSIDFGIETHTSLLLRTNEYKHLTNDSLNDLINYRIKQLTAKNPALILVERNLSGEREKRQIRRMQFGSISLYDPGKKGNTIVAHIHEEKNLFAKRDKHTKQPHLKKRLTFTSEGQRVVCSNVGAYVEGTTLKDEFVVISAHLDHLGKRDSLIYYGADDDGSGCAAILNMAGAFAEANRQGKGPKRSILFLLFTGEEKGLLGSGYYTETPAFPNEKTIANLNIDMIGRVDTVRRTSNRYVYLIGSDKMSTDLHHISEKTNQECCNLNLDYTYNDSAHPMRLYYRSDHYSFVKKGIPAIFYFTGLHDDYHQPTDTVDKIDFDKTASITQLVFATAWELANRIDRIRIDKP